MQERSKLGIKKRRKLPPPQPKPEPIVFIPPAPLTHYRRAFGVVRFGGKLIHNLSELPPDPIGTPPPPPLRLPESKPKPKPAVQFQPKLKPKVKARVFIPAKPLTAYRPLVGLVRFGGKPLHHLDETVMLKLH